MGSSTDPRPAPRPRHDLAGDWDNLYVTDDPEATVRLVVECYAERRSAEPAKA